MADEENVFVELVTDNLLILDRSYPATSVVELPASFAKRLIETKHAKAHGGPAFEPTPAAAEAEAAGEHTPKKHEHGKPTEKGIR